MQFFTSVEINELSIYRNVYVNTQIKTIIRSLNSFLQVESAVLPNCAVGNGRDLANTSRCREWNAFVASSQVFICVQIYLQLLPDLAFSIQHGVWLTWITGKLHRLSHFGSCWGVNQFDLTFWDAMARSKTQMLDQRECCSCKCTACFIRIL